MHLYTRQYFFQPQNIFFFWFSLSFHVHYTNVFCSFSIHKAKFEWCIYVKSISIHVTNVMNKFKLEWTASAISPAENELKLLLIRTKNKKQSLQPTSAVRVPPLVSLVPMLAPLLPLCSDMMPPNCQYYHHTWEVGCLLATLHQIYHPLYAGPILDGSKS